MSEVYSTCWFETRTGARYEMPDMQTDNVDWVCKQLDESKLDCVTALNISGVVMILPISILAKAGTGNRVFWEAGCKKLTPPGEYQKD
ncbi:hypothetical protein UFOVP276_176 [uncultured Caudovirales phage]|uniref:Uncharacterized protein n=1 Tax=uncultured Caudovirales phage TaxID=2100421 RepID=A0A6J5LQD8_9CAUD|nr:hypothetical protein UFOVP127_70 [uncultured Caudovirales phage]CAB4135220.1 hypothetical protein UFOVP276_176 [uncultured Caudovirales phage]